MNKKEAEKEFKSENAQFLKDHKKDRPGRQLAWSIFVDSLHRDGRITQRQQYSWVNPPFAK